MNLEYTIAVKEVFANRNFESVMRDIGQEGLKGLGQAAWQALRFFFEHVTANFDEVIGEFADALKSFGISLATSGIKTIFSFYWKAKTRRGRVHLVRHYMDTTFWNRQLYLLAQYFTNARSMDLATTIGVPELCKIIKKDKDACITFLFKRPIQDNESPDFDLDGMWAAGIC